ncbi:MAG: PAS domain S-box protein [Nitrospirae bacterium]|nr:PAS domain S-box protein [Nitrospirota bacterium]
MTKTDSQPLFQHKFLAQWLILCVTLAAIGGIIVYMLVQQYHSIDSRERERLMSTARIVDKNMFFHLDGINRALEGIREDLPVFRAAGWKSTNRRLKWLSDIMPAVRTLLIIDAEGKILASDREELIGRNFSMRMYFKTPRMHPDPKMLYVSPPFITVNNVLGMALTRVIQGPDGEFAGIVAAIFDPKYFATTLSSVLYAPGMWSALAHSDGTPYLFEPEPEGQANGGSVQAGLVFNRYFQSGHDEDVLTGIVYAADENMVAFHNIKPDKVLMDKYLVVGVGRSLTSVYADWKQNAVAKLAIFGTTTLLLFAGLFLYQQRQKYFDRKAEEAAAAIRDSEENFRILFDKSADAILLVDSSGTIVDTNEVACERYKYSKEEFRGMRIEQLDSPSSAMLVDERIGMINKSGMAVFEVEHITKDGLVIPVEVSSRKIIRGDATLFLSSCRDITERKALEKTLAAEKERLAVTLRSIGDAVVVTDLDGRITLLNTAAEHITGWAIRDALGRPHQDVFNIIDVSTREKCDDPVDKVLQTGLIAGLANNVALIRKDGKELRIADSAAPIRDKDSKIVGVALVFRDVTAQCRMEEELHKVQRLESLGLLAGGLAHDFNNLLTAIIGNISFAKILIEEGHKAYERLTAAETAAARATNITHQLLTFASGGAPIKEAASIADVVKETAEFVLLGSNVKCEYHIGENLWNVEIDRGQIARVFNNLIVNAMQAMSGGGVIDVNFENLTITENQTASIAPGNYVRITVSDSGVGIERDTLAKIFDPYFTTKKQGSGLGLAAVYSIIKRHDGEITVASTPGQGTTFIIYLPATKQAVVMENAGGPVNMNGQGRVLVMDDEALVRDIAGEILALLGYDVSFAEDGLNAINTYKNAAAENKPFSFVIMDLTVPGGMGGKEAVQNILEADPSATVIVSSGYSSDPIMSEYKQYGFKGVITKPYTVQRMSEAIADAFSSMGQA